MKIPKGCDVHFDTAKDPVELQVNGAITDKATADELAAVIKQFGLVLGEKRSRSKPKVVVAA
jgi:hypothetical protein